MINSDIPGFAEAEAWMVQARASGELEGIYAEDLIVMVLKAATPAIMAAMLADLADNIEINEPKFLDSATATARFLDQVSHDIRERTRQ